MSKYRKNADNNYDDRPEQPATTFKEDLVKGRQLAAEFERKQKAARLEKAANTPLPRETLWQRITGTGRSRRRRSRRILTKKLRKRAK